MSGYLRSSIGNDYAFNMNPSFFLFLPPSTLTFLGNESVSLPIQGGEKGPSVSQH